MGEVRRTEWRASAAIASTWSSEAVLGGEAAQPVDRDGARRGARAVEVGIVPGPGRLRRGRRPERRHREPRDVEQAARLGRALRRLAHEAAQEPAAAAGTFHGPQCATPVPSRPGEARSPDLRDDGRHLHADRHPQEQQRDAAEERLPQDRSRLIAAAILGGLAVVFAVINRHEVKVNWLLGTWETPLIVVIGVSFLAGAAIGAFASRRRYRGGKKASTG